LDPTNKTSITNFIQIKCPKESTNKIKQMTEPKCKKHKENNSQKRKKMGQELPNLKMTRKGQPTT